VREILPQAITSRSNPETGIDGDIYVQKIGPDGTPAWTTNGYPASVFFDDQRTPDLV
jgi:hypothetical protein